MKTDEYQELYAGLIRLHILHHACEQPIFGLEMIQELSRHGYRIGAGTLYPILHGMEKKGWVRSTTKLIGGRNRRVYRATPKGRKALTAARDKVQELFGELFEDGRPPKLGCPGQLAKHRDYTSNRCRW
jgi:PadR family transcriptional regulator PadR